MNHLANRSPSFLIHIPDVILVGSRKQMFGIHTLAFADPKAFAYVFQNCESPNDSTGYVYRLCPTFVMIQISHERVTSVSGKSRNGCNKHPNGSLYSTILQPIMKDVLGVCHG